MDREIIRAFVKKELEQIGKDIDQAQERAISKLLHYRTGRLINYRVFDTREGEYIDGQLTITHPAYERFLDIKKRPKVSANVEDWRKRRTKPKAYPIHNRIIMGHYNRLADRLMFGLTEEMAKEIKSQLDNETI